MPQLRNAFIAVLEQPHRDFASFMAESERILVPASATREQTIGAAVQIAVEGRILFEGHPDIGQLAAAIERVAKDRGIASIPTQ